MSTKIIKIVFIGFTVPMCLGLVGWNLLQASTNSRDIAKQGAEFKILLLTLNRIEKGIDDLCSKQDVANFKLSAIEKEQALTNQGLMSHVKIDDKRCEKLEKDLYIFKRSIKNRGIK